MVVPVLYQVRQHFPDLQITVLTRPSFAPLFAGIEHIRIMEADLYGKHKGIKGLYKLSKDIRKLGVDAVADLHNVLRTKLLVLFLRRFFIPIAIIHKDRWRKKMLTRKKKKLFLPLCSTHKRYQFVFNKLGLRFEIDPTIYLPKPPIHPSCINSTKQKIGIAPFAAYEGKRYPLHMMERVIDHLSMKYQLFLIGGKEEAIALASIAKRYPNTVSIAGKYALQEELSLIAHLDLMIAMDSANAHLASMYGTKVLVLWGVTHPYAGFSPFGKKIHHLLADRKRFPFIPTSIYGNKLPLGYECVFETIPPENIHEKALSILKEQDLS